LSLEIPTAAKLQELPKNRHKLTIVFGPFTELREALTYILEHNSDLPLKYIAGNEEEDIDTEAA
jgi:hypothetical protein